MHKSPYLIKVLIVAFISIGLSTGPAFAQVAEEIENDLEQQSASQTAEKPKPVPVYSATALVTMDFQDASLVAILKALSEQSGLNFVAGESVKDKKISLFMNQVTVKEALETILRTSNLTYEQAGGSNIFIVKESGKPPVETITRIVTLNYASAVDRKEKIGENEEVLTEGLDGVIESLLTKEHGNLLRDERTNTLIITDIPEQVERIEKVIKELDTKTPQVMIEAEVLETGANVLRDLGIKWGNQAGELFKFAGPQRSTTFPFARNVSGLFKNSSAPTTFVTSSTVGTTGTTSTTAQGEPPAGIVSLNELQLILKAVENNSKTKILARPKILTLNNRPAEIRITEKTAVASVTTLASSSNLSTATTGQAERIDTGIILKVTPQVNKDGYITMLIEPSVTTPEPSEFFPGVFVDPQTRSTRTNVMIKDGETIVIGGLMNQDYEDAVRKVPIMGDIPILGHFFRTKTKSHVDKELVVFITPHIVIDTPAQLSKPEEIPQIAEALSLEAGPKEEKAAPRRVPSAGAKEKILEREQEPGLTRDEVMEMTLKGLKSAR